MNKITINKLTLTFIFLFLLAFITPPFIFGYLPFVSRTVRLYLGLIAMGLLVLRIKKIQFFDLLILFCAAVLFSIEIVWIRSEISTIFSYHAVVSVYILLFIALKNSKDNREEFLKIWIQFSYFIAVSNIMLYMLHQFTPLNTDVLNFAAYKHLFRYGYRFSIFGVSQFKDFGAFRIVRAHTYFVESQYAGFYFALNVLLAQMINKNKKYNKWFYLNLFAGFCTFSFTFYLAMVVIYTLQILSKRSNFLQFSVILLLLFVVFPLVIFGENRLFDGSSTTINTSFGERELRMLNALNILKNSTLSNFLFGHGTGYRGDNEFGISIGFFLVLVERGLFGLLFVLFMLIVFIRKYFISLMICLLYFFAFHWDTNYIYWMGILALWAGMSETKIQRDDIYI